MAWDWKIITLAVVVSLFHVIAGSSDKTDRDEQGAFVKYSAKSYDPRKSRELRLRNKETRSHSLLFSTRGSQVPPCQTGFQRKDPRLFFKTTDEFFPDYYIEKRCTGSPGPRGFPSCGSGGFMECVTQIKTLYFMRMPKSNCQNRKKVKISNVPVDCDCMRPY